ncbi:copper chaperone PCu(A)C [Streptomyces sp. NPDC002838]|uniref:copper chaperone PCu(A)C n=1 Tax=Streptomyces sp. NPDC002838 TaxID=3154436 RepID=UPI0033275025
MSSSLRRGALAAAAIAFSIASLAACGAGNNAQTLEIRPDNAATSVGDIKIQNAVVITQPDPEAKGPAVVSATLFNTGGTDQTLESISVAGAGTAELKPATGNGEVTVPAGGSVILGGEGNASASLKQVGESVKDGNAQKVTFTFSKTGEVSLRAFVVPADGYFSKWGPTEVPAAPGAGASATPSGEPGAGEEPGEGASGTPTGTASPGTPDDATTPTDAASASTTESPAADH